MRGASGEGGCAGGSWTARSVDCGAKEEKRSGRLYRSDEAGAARGKKATEDKRNRRVLVNEPRIFVAPKTRQFGAMPNLYRRMTARHTLRRSRRARRRTMTITAFGSIRKTRSESWRESTMGEQHQRPEEKSWRPWYTPVRPEDSTALATDHGSYRVFGRSRTAARRESRARKIMASSKASGAERRRSVGSARVSRHCGEELPR